MASFLRPSMEYRCVTRLILLINNATVTRSLNLINCGYIALYLGSWTEQTENCLINAHSSGATHHRIAVGLS